MWKWKYEIHKRDCDVLAESVLNDNINDDTCDVIVSKFNLLCKH